MPSTATTRAPRRSPAQRRAEIHAAARDLAAEQGLAAVTLRAVAARVDVTPALVAHYVPSMDDLVATTFTTLVGEELDEIVARATGSGTVLARLWDVVGSLLDGTRDDVTLVWVDAFAMGRRNDLLAEAVREAMDRWQEALCDLIAAGVSAGALRVERPADAAWQLLGMIDGLNAQSLVRWGGASDRAILIEGAVEGLLGIEPGTLSRAAEHETGGIR